jgi:hypothetical protein
MVTPLHERWADARLRERAILPVSRLSNSLVPIMIRYVEGFWWCTLPVRIILTTLARYHTRFGTQTYGLGYCGDGDGSGWCRRQLAPRNSPHAAFQGGEKSGSLKERVCVCVLGPEI